MAKAQSRVAKVLAAVFRIILLTALFAALGMGVGLFAGIMGTIIYNAVKHTNIDLATAYRSVAIPSAVVCGALALLYNIGMTIRTAMRSHA